MQIQSWTLEFPEQDKKKISSLPSGECEQHVAKMINRWVRTASASMRHCVISRCPFAAAKNSAELRNTTIR